MFALPILQHAKRLQSTDDIIGINSRFLAKVYQTEQNSDGSLQLLSFYFENAICIRTTEVSTTTSNHFTICLW
jgi:hypothetical protein